MTAGAFVLVALAGGVGAALRLLVDGVVRARLGSALPWGTIAINLSGSLLLGLVTGLTAGASPVWAAVVGTGLLGGYTTFSTASIETVRLLQARRWGAAVVPGAVQPVLAVALALAAYAVGAALVP